MRRPIFSERPPVHFWIIAVVSTLWHLIGTWDFIATQIPVESYMANFTPEQQAYFFAFPLWLDIVWCIAVFAALLGSLGMLARSRWAFLLFLLSLLAMVVTSLYTYVFTEGAELTGLGGTIFSIVIFLVAVFLVLYNKAMLRRGILR